MKIMVFLFGLATLYASAQPFIIGGDPVYLPTQTGLPNVTSGLVGWWKLDEGTGTTANDSSGQGHTATLWMAGTQSPWWTNGFIGPYCCGFTNGVTNVIVTFSTAHQITNGSITWWQYLSDAYNSGKVRGIWGEGTDSTVSKLDAQIYSDNKFYVGWTFSSDTRVNIAASAANAPQTNWAHYAFVWKTNSLLYMNGVPIGTNASAPSTGTSGRSFVIGAYGNTNATTARFAGRIDDVRMYNYALSSNDVNTIYNWRP